MPSVIVGGRMAWWAAIVAGIIIAIVGAVAFHPASTIVILAGCAFFVFGLVFLIMSYATRGATD